jgi:hypothetical protein
MARNEDAMSSKIYASISLMMRRITKMQELDRGVSLWDIVEVLFG